MTQWTSGTLNKRTVFITEHSCYASYAKEKKLPAFTSAFQECAVHAVLSTIWAYAVMNENLHICNSDAIQNL